MGVLDQDPLNNVGHTTTNTYDALNRLTSSVAAGPWAYNLTYGYDRYGNMQCVLNQNTNGLCPQWGVNGATNGLTSPYGYDAAGHMTGDGTHTYQYDAEGRLAAVDGGSTVKYVYNALGQRVDSVASGSVYRETYYDAFGRPAVTQNHTVTLEDFFPPVGGRNFVKFGGDPSGETLFLHADAQGTTGIITNEVNGESQDQTYYPYGGVWAPGTQAYDTRFGSLEERDAATGFDPTPARQYTSTLGRWLTPDPAGRNAVRLDDPQSWNMYAYARNNPTTLTDPSGLYTVSCAEGDKKCLKAASNFEKQRLRDLRSKHEDLRKAAAAWGSPTDKNGITLTFKPQAALEAEYGRGTQAAVTPGQTSNHKPDIQAEFSEGLAGSDLRQAIGHEGTHVEDDLSFLNSYDSSTGRFNAGMNFTHYITEFNAFVVGAEVKHYNNLSCGGQPCSFGPNDYGNIDRYLTTTQHTCVRTLFSYLIQVTIRKSRRLVQMRRKLRVLSFFALSTLCVSSTVAEDSGCRRKSPAEPVPYCELVRNPESHDGQIVLTEAVWEGLIHSGALADRRCSAVGSSPALTLPSFSKDGNFNSERRKALWKILAKGGIARVDLIGVFHAHKDRDYGPEGQRFQIEIECLLSVVQIPNSSSQ